MGREGVQSWNHYPKKIQLRKIDLAISCHWYLSITTENIKKPRVLGCFQGIGKETKGIKRVNKDEFYYF